MTTITAEMIKAAEALVGVDYTAAERAQMLDNLEGQIASAKARRGVALANSVPMALQCHPPDPRPMPDAKGASVAAGFWAMDAPSGRNLGFSAVFSANDSQALGALRNCRKYRLRLPQDVAIVGFDTIEFGATAVTPICAIL